MKKQNAKDSNRTIPTMIELDYELKRKAKILGATLGVSLKELVERGLIEQIERHSRSVAK